ncbi:unnamed protein product [Ixodes pacificus]
MLVHRYQTHSLKLTIVKCFACDNIYKNARKTFCETHQQVTHSRSFILLLLIGECHGTSATFVDFSSEASAEKKA